MIDFYYFWAILLLVGNGLAWASNLFLLPGNWIIVVFSAGFAAAFHERHDPSVSWTAVAVLVGIAVFGEVIELVAGSAGAAKQGASRRAMLLSVVGAVFGSAAGVIVGLPVPFVGSLVAAVLGGAAGAFIGGFLGETWKGRTLDKSASVGTAAFFGRIIGTLGKLWAGAIMAVIVTWDSLF